MQASQRYLMDRSNGLGINNNPRSGEDPSSTDMSSDYSLESEQRKPFSLVEYLD